MVKLTGPIQSLDAAGTIAKTITVSKWKGRHYLKKRSIPTDPLTGKQQAYRALVAWLSQFWPNLTDNQKATWANFPNQDQLSPYNAFVGHNVNRFSRMAGLTKTYPATEDDVNGTLIPSSPTVDDGIQSVTAKIAVGTFNDTWCVLSFLSQDPAILASLENLHAITWFDLHEVKYQLITPLALGTWYLRCRINSAAGLISAAGSATNGESLPP